MTPKLSVGASFNYYHIDPLAGDSIRSRTTARYSGRSESRVKTDTTRTTSGSYSATGVATRIRVNLPMPIKTPIAPQEGDIVAFTDNEDCDPAGRAGGGRLFRRGE